MNGLSAEGFRTALVAACDAMHDAHDELSRLDAQAGDGDLGATMATGFAAVRARIEEERFETVSELLAAAAGDLGRKAPSTMGSLLSAGLRGAASRLRGDADPIDARAIATMLEAIRAQVEAIGGAVEGQRSVLDAMGPAARAALAAADGGRDVEVALSEAARAASAGAAATAAMTPEVGRAAWIADRARGSQDAGATAYAVLLGALARAVITQASRD